MNNEEIADILSLTSKLLDLHGENEFKAKSFSIAAFQIDKFPKELTTLTDDEISKVPGVGKSMFASVKEIITTGTLEQTSEWIAKTPEGVLEMMLKVKGIGPKKVRAIWTLLEIENVGELLYACEENRLIDLKGFGEKTQENVIQQIHFINASKGKFFFSEGLAIGDSLIEFLQQNNEDAQISLCGDVRRKETTLDKIELITDIDKEILIQQLKTINGFEILSDENEMVKGRFANRFPIEIVCTDDDQFVLNSFMSSSTEAHHQSMEIDFTQPYADENEIYESNDLPFIIPELRDRPIDEINLTTLNEIISLENIKGVIHNHTKYSDGKNTVAEMAAYAKSKGCEYIVISDHSKTATYAQGLKEADIYRQHDEIDSLREQFAPFRIFKSIESDILGDGSLDYDDEVLKLFDCVIASVHQNIRMNEETAMRRLFKAIENPYTTILGHPTGRLLLARPGYPINHEMIIDACAANNVVIELNANPHRLDIDWQWINYAMNKNVMIAINPDAHKLVGIDDIQWGVAAARKGGLTKSFCFNTLNAVDVEKYFQKKKKGLG